MTITRTQALSLLSTHTQNPNLRRHCLAVGVVMRALARQLGGDPDVWEVLGLIHDSDWEQTKDQPDQHTRVTLARLADLGLTSGPIVRALMSHNTKHTHLAELEGLMEWTLECCDELTGFIVACTLVSPSKKIADLSVDSILKKFPQKSFAAAVDRAQISQCEPKLGIPLDSFVQISLTAMQSIAPDLGL
jgi:predicted hydrolase (HD superfamily)